MTDEQEKSPDAETRPEDPLALGEKKPIGVEKDKPPPDEFLGRGNKKKKPLKTKAGKPIKPPKSLVDQQIDAAVAASSLQEKKKKRGKRNFRLGIAAAVVGLLGYGVYWGFAPYSGTMAFGICKVFLEGTIRYPSMLRISTVEEFESSVRIWYTQVDSFGATRMEPIQCYYGSDETRGTFIERVAINRRDVPQKQVDDFNRALSSIAAVPIDLTIPAPLPDSLQDLQFDTMRFRKPIL